MSKHMEKDLLQNILRQSKKIVFIEILMAFGLFGIVAPTTDIIMLPLAWAFAVSFICILAKLSVYGLHRFAEYNEEEWSNTAWIWTTVFAISAGISAIAIVSGVIFVNAENTMQALSVLLLLAALTTVCCLFYAGQAIAYTVFTLTLFLLFDAYLCLMQAGTTYLIPVVMSFIYAATMITIAFRMQQSDYLSFLYALKNTENEEKLAATKKQLANRTTHALEKSLGLMKATLEATKDAALIVNIKNKVEDFNIKVRELFNVPLSLLEEGDLNKIIQHIADELVEPDKILNLPKEDADKEIHGEFVCADGRIFEFILIPQYMDNQCIGKLYTFREITERKLNEMKLSQRVYEDTLTGLPNRTLLMDRLVQATKYARKEKGKFALALIDIDKFKAFNDRMGHAIGDKLLTVMTERLQQHLNENDTLFRINPDTFAILLNSDYDERDIDTIAQHCLESTREPFIVEGHRLTITVSIGISFYPKDGIDADILLKNADTAMYRSKEQGGNMFQYFTAAMNKKLQERLLVESHLHNALKYEEFSLMYHPIVNVAEKCIGGVEVLLRWHHGILGTVSPGVFIPIAEHNGMIIPIGDWVLKHACEQIMQWKTENHFPLYLAVNLSAKQYLHPKFIEHLKSILTETKLQPDHLTLELTEHMVMSHFEESKKILTQLKEIGVMLALDDFGTGFSNLNYLSQLPLDKIKIDRSFIDKVPAHPEVEKLIACVIAIAKEMHFKVVAEGVGNVEQMQFLLQHDCFEVQGFYFHQPLKTEEFTRLIASGTQVELIPEADADDVPDNA